MELDFLKKGEGARVPEAFKEVQHLVGQFARNLAKTLDGVNHRLTGEFYFGLNEHATLEIAVATYMQQVNGEYVSGLVFFDQVGDTLENTSLINCNGCDQLMVRDRTSRKNLNTVFRLDKYLKFRDIGKKLVRELTDIIVDIDVYSEKHYYRYALDEFGMPTITEHHGQDKTKLLDETKLFGKTLGWFRIAQIPVMVEETVVHRRTIMPIFEPESFPINPLVAVKMPLNL